MKNCISILTLLFLLQSCVTPLYLPNTANTPTLLEKGDLEVSGYVGTNAYGLQSAYAITDKLGIMLNGSFDNSHSDSSNKYREHLFFEIAPGYTHILNPDVGENDTKYLFTGFAGFGYGHAEGLRYEWTVNYEKTNFSDGDFYRIFIQPTWSMSHNNFEFSTSVRTNFLKFNYLRNYLADGWSEITPDGKKYNLFYEPTITFKVGGKAVKGVLQLGASIPQFSNNETAFRGRELIIIFGINANLRNN